MCINNENNNQNIQNIQNNQNNIVQSILRTNGYYCDYCCDPKFLCGTVFCISLVFVVLAVYHKLIS